MAKFIFVTGGVVSGLGKGITAASLGRLLKSRGFDVTALKFDPYVNVDAGTMSPLQHGEVFVTEDGAETDLDLGHYERFIDVNLSKNNNVTTGKIYNSVIQKERKGEFLGGTVQVIPHVTNEIKERLMRVARESRADIVICEVGGTVGDIESLPFLEAIRQFRSDVGREDVMYIHVTLVPYIHASGEQKTKPTQHSVRELRSIGIQPDAIVARTENPFTREMKDKIALFCDIEKDAVIENIDAASIYEVPILLEEQGLGNIALRKLGLSSREKDMAEWRGIVKKIKNPEKHCRIALVGKYIALHDAYLSLSESLAHAGIANDCKVEIHWVFSEDLERDPAYIHLGDDDGVLVPGAFGYRGIEGKCNAVRYAREKEVPFLGICMGMQCAVIEFSRNVLGLKGANSTEFETDTGHPVIDLMPEQKDIENMGGTMRLGAYPCRLTPGTKAFGAYGTELIYERHRHRFEVNNAYRDKLAAAGFKPVGVWPQGNLVEMMELDGHPWFVGTQFHPEFKSRPTRVHPLFRDFVKAALAYRAARKGE
ncbi:MAG: CTP synthase [Firmicutes bacterium]|nr:CTP synthase [Bacillota bacterium]